MPFYLFLQNVHFNTDLQMFPALPKCYSNSPLIYQSNEHTFARIIIECYTYSKKKAQSIYCIQTFTLPFFYSKIETGGRENHEIDFKMRIWIRIARGNQRLNFNRVQHVRANTNKQTNERTHRQYSSTKAEWNYVDHSNKIVTKVVLTV